MTSSRRTAAAVGVLFIVATAMSLAATALTDPYLTAPHFLQGLARVGDRIALAALLVVAAGLSVALIPPLLFPVLKKRSEGLALGYVAIRIVEAATLIADAMVVLLMVTLGRQFVHASPNLRPVLEAVGTLLQGAHSWAFLLNPLVFGPGALIFYYVLLRARLVPVWLSVWGLIGAVCVIALGLLAMFGRPMLLLAVPIGVQEMVLAVWLILRGFAIEEPAQT